MFSVIIPVYNKAQYLNRSILSVLNQSFQNFEIIIVDDASTDNSLEIIDAFSDERIIVIKRSKRGYGGYAARNIGVENASFEYVAFLDADDTWSENHLFEISKAIEKFPAVEFFTSGWYLRTEFVEKIDSYSVNCKKNTIHIVDNFFQCASKGQSPAWTSVVVLTKKLFVQTGGFPAGKCKKGGDVEFWLRCIISSDLVHTSKITASYFKDISDSVTRTVKDFEIPYVFESVRNIINLNTSKNVSIRDIKKYSNFYSKIAILRSIIEGQNKRNILTCYFKEQDNAGFYFLKTLSFFPPFLLRPLYKLYRKIQIRFAEGDLG